MKYNIDIEDFGRKTWKSGTWNSTDTQENYKEISSTGLKNIYRPEDFDYKYNSNHFRCDEFTLNSEFPILFAGCSITEGVGVPIEHTWSHILLEKIRQATGKNIPYWNIGTAGTGIDTIARLTYLFAEKLNAKYLFIVMPMIFRREYSAEDKSNIAWNIINKCNDGSQYPYANSVNELFYDQTFAECQTSRSCMIIDSTLKSINCEAYTTSWLRDDTHEREVLKMFPYLNYHRNTTRIVCTDVGRDNMHPGPIWHRLKAEEIWNNVKHKFT
jgi:hypothetical protein